MPGGLQYQHIMHTVEVSFHVADVIRDKMFELIETQLKSFQSTVTSSSSDKTSYESNHVRINSWEMDEVYSSLYAAIQSSPAEYKS